MIDYKMFCEQCRKTDRHAFLIIRHSERPSISVQDPSFGGDLPLTERGVRMAREAGELLKRHLPERMTSADWTFRASPLLRTKRTAKLMAEGMRIEDAAVEDALELGIPGVWMYDTKLAHDCHEREGARVFNNRVVSNGVGEGYYPQDVSAKRLLEWIRKTMISTQFGLFLTHDIFLALFLQAMGAGKFSTEGHWVGYLQGAALFEREDGRMDVSYCVPDLQTAANSYIV